MRDDKIREYFENVAEKSRKVKRMSIDYVLDEFLPIAGTLHAMFLLQNDGEMLPEIELGGELLGAIENGVLVLNISLNACKYFNYDGNCIVGECRRNGKPQRFSIPKEYIMRMSADSFIVYETQIIPLPTPSKPKEDVPEVDTPDMGDNVVSLFPSKGVH